MKSFILVTFSVFLHIGMAISQNNKMTRAFISIVEKDTLCWEHSDSSCALVRYKSDGINEKILVFGQASPPDKLKSIKFEDTLCGILTESPIDITYFLIRKKEGIWKIIKFFSWSFFGVTDERPNNILSITLNSARQIVVVEKGNKTEIISLDINGKDISAIRKE